MPPSLVRVDLRGMQQAAAQASKWELSDQTFADDMVRPDLFIQINVDIRA